MLIQLLVQHPQVLPAVLKGTPTWVWLLAAGLAALGIGQLRRRTVSQQRVLLLPVAMTAFSLWGMSSAFGASPDFLAILALWAVTGGVVLAAMGALAAPAGARYDPAARAFTLPGSAWPLVLIAGTFIVKYVVGVDIAMQPALVRDSGYTLSVAALYGAFSGMFAGRALRMWRLTARAAALA
jgi:hypothetical protein